MLLRGEGGGEESSPGVPPTAMGAISTKFFLSVLVPKGRAWSFFLGVATLSRRLGGRLDLVFEVAHVVAAAQE